jgi:hypothetical protein
MGFWDKVSELSDAAAGPSLGDSQPVVQPSLLKTVIVGGVSGYLGGQAAVRVELKRLEQERQAERLLDLKRGCDYYELERER